MTDAAPPSKRILVVDPDEAVRRLVCRVLEAARYHCTHTQNGFSALVLLEKNPYDLLLFDRNLPVMRGKTVAQVARRLHPKIGIIAMSAVPEGVGTTTIDVDDLLVKPFQDLSLIVRTAENVLWIREQRGNGSPGGTP